jgi:hypothetical protein
MTAYPVTFNVTRPEKFERTQVVLRILVILALSLLGGIIGWSLGLVYLALPVLAAVLISQRGGARYLEDRGGPAMTLLQWYLALYTYLSMLADKFPSEPEEIISFEVRTQGTPSVGSALLRLIYSIPSAIVLALLAIIAAFIWIVAVVSVLINESYSEGLYNLQLGIMRWHARLLGYHASLVDQYPPFALDTGPEATLDPINPEGAAP